MSLSPIKALLDQLCVQQGFCLPTEEVDRLIANPPQSTEAFVEAVFSAEGLNAAQNPRLYRKVRDLVSEHFRHWENESAFESNQSEKWHGQGAK